MLTKRTLLRRIYSLISPVDFTTLVHHRTLVRTETRIMETLAAGAGSEWKDCRYRLRCVKLPLVPLLALVALQQRGARYYAVWGTERGLAIISANMYSDRPNGGYSLIDDSD